MKAIKLCGDDTKPRNKDPFEKQSMESKARFFLWHNWPWRYLKMVLCLRLFYKESKKFCMNKL